MFPRAQIRPSGTDHILIDTFGEFDMAFLAWLKTLEMRNAFISQWSFKNSTYKIPVRFIKDTEAELKKYYLVVEVVQAIPQTPVTYRVEYIGACKKRVDTGRNVFGQKVKTCTACGGIGLGTRNMGRQVGWCIVCGGSGRETTTATTESYASAWSNGDWSLIFPEIVLRKFFPQQVKFDGNFHKLLLEATCILCGGTGKRSDEEKCHSCEGTGKAALDKNYRQLGRRFHPDAKQGSVEAFRRLKQAFDDLKDPQRRKRYEAGLRFAAKEPEEATVFRVPRTCGDVTAIVGWESERAKEVVKEILSWSDITDAAGRVMSSRFRDINRNPPFDIEWNYTGEFEVDL